MLRTVRFAFSAILWLPWVAIASTMLPGAELFDMVYASVYLFELIFASPADRTYPVLGQLFERRSWFDA